ncbi:MAG: Nif11-like leader peptide family RiPP precursor [Desulfotomaculaceae bacterium]|nr:Nif11-like leader peptide family RiPP precursor [Desulfotomaculaceae bacterium]
MSMENIKNFFARVRENENLQQQFKELASTSAENYMQALVEIAHAQGFSFEKNDLEAYFSGAAKNLNSAEELNEADLDAVAGGGLFDWISMSVATVGFGCAASAAHRNTYSGCPLDN